MKGHSYFTATNARSHRTYSVDSMSFPNGTYRTGDLPNAHGNWSFGIAESQGKGTRHPYSASAAKAFAQGFVLDRAEQLRTAPRFYAYVDDTLHDGYLTAGTPVTSFRGEPAIFQYISRAPVPGKSAKVVVSWTTADDDHGFEYYAQVFNIRVCPLEGSSAPARFAAPIGQRIEPESRKPRPVITPGGEVIGTYNEERS